MTLSTGAEVPQWDLGLVKFVLACGNMKWLINKKSLDKDNTIYRIVKKSIFLYFLHFLKKFIYQHTCLSSLKCLVFRICTIQEESTTTKKSLFSLLIARDLKLLGRFLNLCIFFKLNSKRHIKTDRKLSVNTNSAFPGFISISKDSNISNL